MIRIRGPVSSRKTLFKPDPIPDGPTEIGARGGLD